MSKSLCLVCNKHKNTSTMNILQFNEGVCGPCSKTQEGKESLGIEED